MSRVPILAFHAIEDGPPPLCIPPEVFARQVRALRDAGCRALTVSDLAARLGAGEELPERTIAITFDDGYASTLHAGLPILEDAGFVATVFPVTGTLGGTNSWDGAGARMMTTADLLRLRAAGWEVGGHTHSHRSLPGLPPREASMELARSTAVLEDLLGDRVGSFAFPYGRHDAASRALASAVYDACLLIGASRAGATSRLDRLERIDAWYVRRPFVARHLHAPLGGAYLAMRRLGRAAAAPARRLGGAT